MLWASCKRRGVAQEVNLKEVQDVLINDEGHLTCPQGVLINYEYHLTCIQSVLIN
jgi:hypothetical protein